MIPAMDRISLVCIFSVLNVIAAGNASAAKMPVQYRSYLDHVENRRDGVLLRKYDSFNSVLPSHIVKHLHKRQSEGDVEANATTQYDHHTYYTSKFLTPGENADGLWFELSNIIGSGAIIEEELGENTSEVLSGLHRYYQYSDLKFQFPYYGHILNRVAVTTGGFLYMGSIDHDQIHLTQYIAPLMADFNPSLGTGRVLVYSTEDRFTVQWDQVLNHDHESDGPFTFQVSIFPSGQIHFAYRQLPLFWYELNNENHPVEIGISDALYFDVPQAGITYIIEYSRINVTNLLPNISTDLSYSAFKIDPVLNCVVADTCDSCMNITRQGIFNCSWCEAAQQKCSDGVDRYTQDWFNSGCFSNALSVCPVPTTGATSVVSGSSSLPPGSVAGIVVGITLLLLAVVAVSIVGFLFFYGYQHPTSKIGMFMIEKRPQAWKLNRGTKQSSKYEMHEKFADEG